MAERKRALENMDVTQFGRVYDGRNVLITGHTGFKGSWLSLWLTELGAKVTGIALAPDTEPNHWDMLALPAHDVRLDIRDASRLTEVVNSAHPEIVFHLAAQPLVRRSYLSPLETWSTNVMGTATLLETCRRFSGLIAVVVVTTDKVYESQERPGGYGEGDRLGGTDPYSASKAAAELVASSYRQSFFNRPDAPLLATARAGNVIGGGDWSQDRLIPDIVRAIASGKTVDVRSPDATRPWQHVLDCLSGYLLLGQHLLEEDRAAADCWNFGPDVQDNRTVRDVLDGMAAEWPELSWRVDDEGQHPPETGVLRLNSEKAKSSLGWRPVWTFGDALGKTVAWYQAHLTGEPALSRRQLNDYVACARTSGAAWCGA